MKEYQQTIKEIQQAEQAAKKAEERLRANGQAIEKVQGELAKSRKDFDHSGIAKARSELDALEELKQDLRQEHLDATERIAEILHRARNSIDRVLQREVKAVFRRDVQKAVDHLFNGELVGSALDHLKGLVTEAQKRAGLRMPTTINSESAETNADLIAKVAKIDTVKELQKII